MRINLGEKENLEPNLAPLLDCIFLLLIFFLVATTFDKNEPQDEVKQLNIQLPDSAAGFAPVEVAHQPLVIGIDRRGRYTFDGQSLEIKQLHQKLRLQAQADPSRRIRIDGDKNTSLQHVVHLLDLCEFEGLYNIGVRTNAD